MNFKKITNERMLLAKNKFLEHGKGIVMAKHQAFEDPNAQAQRWHDLIDPSKWSESTIIHKMKSLYRSIIDSCPDPVLDKADVFYTFITERDVRVEYTYEDAYLFLRAALLERQSTDEYKAVKAEINSLKETIERAKTPKQKAEEAKERLKKLEKQL